MVPAHEHHPGRPLGATRATLCINPVVDVVLELDWASVGGVWHVTRARVADAVGGRPTAAAGSAREAFAARAAAALDRAPSPATRSLSVATFAGRLAATLRGLDALGRDVAASTGTARAIATAGAALPERGRGGLVPVAAHAWTDGWTVLVASPRRPDLFVFVDLDTAGRATRVASVDLADAAGRGRS